MQWTKQVTHARPVYKPNLYDFVDKINFILGGSDSAWEWLQKQERIKRNKQKKELKLFEIKLMLGLLKD